MVNVPFKVGDRVEILHKGDDQYWPDPWVDFMSGLSGELGYVCGLTLSKSYSSVHVQLSAGSRPWYFPLQALRVVQDSGENKA